VINSPDIDPWLLENLVCPRDHQPLRPADCVLTCEGGHSYPVVDGVPVMLLDDVKQTFVVAEDTLRRAHGKGGDARAPDLYLESLGISEDEKSGVIELARHQPVVDAVVQHLVAATNGLMYRHLIGGLDHYPIPEIALPPGNGRHLLDVGCSWGRWTLAAHARGYTAVGIDPSLGAVMAARRVARQLQTPTRYVVGDARHLPFARAKFDAVYSYSVLQHLSRDDAARSTAEMGRVLKAGGTARVQMPTRYGLRCAYHQLRRGFSDGAGFDVRYWSLPELRRMFTERIGPTAIDVDCYFGIGLQQADARLMTPAGNVILTASSALKAASRAVPALAWVADSVFVQSMKPN
jgi:SAM-dependent methyltransferase